MHTQRVHLQCSVRPDVSIIIPTILCSDLLFECLASIGWTCDPALQYEVIVVVNGTPLDAERVAARVSGATVVCMGSNVGFAAACNRGARYASGTHLVLLNDDTRVRNGWLSSLVATVQSRPGIGAVGSKILFADGRLQEAGSIVLSDGSTLGIGRHAPGNAREASRRVTYCSACSLLVPRRIWTDLGGLDEGYHPAYYEDVDFCLRLQARGLEVVYDPESVIEHHESASSHSDYRLFLFSWNRRRFARKWTTELGAFESALPAALRRAEWLAAGAPKRLLIVDDSPPDVTGGSGFGRMRDTIREVTDNGWVVDFWASSPMPGITGAGSRCEVVAAPLETHLRQPHVNYDAVLASRPQNFASSCEVVRRLQPQAALIYDGEALYHLRLTRKAALGREDERPAICAEADTMRRLETGIRAKADAVVCVSREEAAFFRSTPGSAPIHHILPLVSGARATERRFEDRDGAVLAAGWMGGEDSPNVDGLHWFCDEVLPVVLSMAPDFRLFVTGRPPASVLKLAGEQIVLLGVIDDLHDVYDRVRAAIVPIRVGAGVKIKFIEALQYGVPVVSTTVGAEGVENLRHPAASVNDDARLFATALADVCGSASTWLAARRAITDSSVPWSRRPEAWAAMLHEVCRSTRPVSSSRRVT